MYIMSKENCSAIDNLTISEYKIPGIILMENAAQQIFNNIKCLGTKYIIFCGNGNNGADGLAIGRKLILEGKLVYFILIKPKENPSEEYSINREILKKLKAKVMIINSIEQLKALHKIIKEFEIVVDSILGIGLHSQLNDFYKELVDIINKSNKKIISVDVPSGLDCNTGKPLGSAVKANITYTVEVIKKGFINYDSFKYLGDLKVVSIGIPKEVKRTKDEKFYILSKAKYSSKLKERSIYSHKGDYGRAVLFAGSIGYLGAARLCTEACIKSGAGLTTLVTTKEGQKLLSGSIVEGMLATTDDEKKIKELLVNADAIAFGPGIKEDEENNKLLEVILDNTKVPIVLDAGGINLISKKRTMLNKLTERVILTPHPGEMARLIEKDISYVEENRVECAKNLAKQYKCIVLLKGYNTIITNGINTYVNTTGNSKMASGGMGDTLTGIITSLIAQGHNSMDAALLGAYIHGLAAEEAGKEKYSIIASDLIENISIVMNNI